MKTKGMALPNDCMDVDWDDRPQRPAKRPRTVVRKAKQPEDLNRLPKDLALYLAREVPKALAASRKVSKHNRQSKAVRQRHYEELIQRITDKYSAGAIAREFGDATSTTS